MEINTCSMILGFPRFPLHWKVHENVWKSCIVNDSEFHTLPTSQEKSKQMYGNLYIFNDSRLPTLPNPPKKMWKSLHFQCFWASHVSHSTEEIMENVWKSMLLQWFGASHASHSTEEVMDKLSKRIHLQWFWTSRASHSTEEITENALRSIRFQ